MPSKDHQQCRGAGVVLLRDWLTSYAGSPAGGGDNRGVSGSGPSKPPVVNKACISRDPTSR